MRQNTLEWLNLEISAYFLNLGGNHLICVLWFDHFGGSLESVPCGENDISLFTLCLSTDNNGVTTFCWVTVNMSS